MTYDPINRPAHYAAGRRFETIDVLEQYFPEEPLLWQVGKYLSRCGRKGEGLPDLKKAHWYLTRWLDNPHQLPAIYPEMGVNDVLNDWYEADDPVRVVMFNLLQGVLIGRAAGLEDLRNCETSLLDVIFFAEPVDTISQTVKDSLHGGNGEVSKLDSLSFDAYQEAAVKTAIYNDKYSLLYPALGLCGEAGEVAEKVKKLYRDHDGIATDDFKAALVKELGDVQWYVATLARDIGRKLSDVAQVNLDKLRGRAERGTIRGNGDDR